MTRPDKIEARLDHVAIQVPELDEGVTFLVACLGMKVKRTGIRHRTGRRIVLLADGGGMKIELAEEPLEPSALLHIAYRVPDVTETYQRLVASGCQSVTTPLRLEAARGDFATVRHPSGLHIQLVRYDPDSPDL